MFIIAFYGPDGSFHHAIADTDEKEIKRHFNLLKETRSKERIPLMKLFKADLGEPLDTHMKE